MQDDSFKVMIKNILNFYFYFELLEVVTQCIGKYQYPYIYELLNQ